MIKQTRIIVYLIIVVALLSSIGLYSDVPPTAAAEKEEYPDIIDITRLQPYEKREKTYPQLSSDLDRLVEAEEQDKAGEFAQPRGIELLDGAAKADSVKVLIECVPGQVKAVAEVVETYGTVGVVISIGVSAIVPIASLPALANEESIEHIRLPDSGEDADEPVISEGVEVINADEWIPELGPYDGTGVKIGIIDRNFADFTTRPEGDELPYEEDYEAYSEVTTIDAGDSAHGTEVTEIVYDIASGADYYLARWTDEYEFEDAVNWFIEEGVDVICCAGGFPLRGPGDGNGFVGDIIETARNAGILWVQAAGNYAKEHWQGSFNDPDEDGYNNFYGADEAIAIYDLAEDDEISVYLRWDDTWGYANEDYDIHIYGPEGFFEVADDEQNGDDEPYEHFSWTVEDEGDYLITIYAVNEAARGRAAEFDLFARRHDMEEYYQVPESSIMVGADSPDAMTVGAVDHEYPDVIMDYSSRGPNKAGVIKPDLVAPTNVETWDGGFTGTCAATAHAAGAAVLVKDAYPSYTPAQIQDYLERHAHDLGSTDDVGEIGSKLDELEFDTSFADSINAVKLDDGVLALFYYNSGGIVKTYSIEPDGTIDEDCIDSWTFEAGIYQPGASTPEVADGIYFVVYRGPSNYLTAQTIAVDADGAITKEAVDSASFEEITIPVRVEDVAKKGDTRVYVAVWWDGDQDGQMAVLTVDEDGTDIANTDTWEFEPNRAYMPRVAHVTGDIFVVSYRGTTEGQLSTFAVDDDGLITESLIDTVTIDSTNNAMDAPILKLTDDLFAVVYRDSSQDGRISTFTIDEEGDITGPISNYEFETGKAYYSENIHLGTDCDGTTYMAIYYNNYYDGYIKTLAIDSTGEEIEYRDYYKFEDNNFGSGYAPPIAVWDGVYVFAWSFSPGTDGFLTIVDIGILKDNTYGSGRLLLPDYP